MPIDNPIKNLQTGPDTVDVENFNNLNTIKRVSIGGQELVTERTSTQPNDDGTYTDNHILYVHSDRNGNPLPQDPTKAIISHSGIITTDENTALCNSWLHWGQRSKIIAIGQDGHESQKGAICSHCYRWQITINFVLFIILFGVIIGILHGLIKY